MMYQVAIIARPAEWSNRTPDDVPPVLTPPFEVTAEYERLLEAVGRATQHNQHPGRKTDLSWAVVVAPGTRSRLWSGPRLCTPVVYKLARLVRPEGWEPAGPYDVPNCIWKAQSGASGGEMSLAQAVDTMCALNRQSIDLADTSWFVPVAIENEPLEESITYDSAGIETVRRARRLEVIRPAAGGRGDCSYCPAHDFPCRRAEQPGAVETEVTRGLEQP
jgi:hypothetical protein